MNDPVTVTAEVLCNGINCPMLGEAYSYVIPLAEYIQAVAFPYMSLI